MPNVDSLDCGWERDLPDRRDFTPNHFVVRSLLSRLERPKKSAADPSQVDWREYCAPVQNQEAFATGPAHACIGLIQYFERRASGRAISPSRLFLHLNANRLAGRRDLRCGTSLRMTLKSAVKFGLPPERYWPYDLSTVDRVPDSFLYGFARRLQTMRYVRLDPVTQSGREVLQSVRSFIAAGFSCTVGFGVPSSVTDDPHIPFPTRFDSIRTGHAVTAVGYDDALRIRSEKGALLIRNSWGMAWGDEGYGWLPYRYLTDRLCGDIWTLLRPKWLNAGDFLKPV